MDKGKDVMKPQKFLEALPETPYPITCEMKDSLAAIKNNDYSEASELFKAISDAARIAIIESLGEGSLCVCVLVEVTGLQYSALSYHLKMLKDVGLVRSKKDGNFLVYSLTKKGKTVQEFIHGTAGF